mgnify:CR=1 FL=1
MSALPTRVLAVIPPMTQLNTPYPSTAYLTGFLRSRGITAMQEDLALALVLKLLSREGLQAVQVLFHHRFVGGLHDLHAFFTVGKPFTGNGAQIHALRRTAAAEAA